MKLEIITLGAKIEIANTNDSSKEADPRLTDRINGAIDSFERELAADNQFSEWLQTGFHGFISSGSPVLDVEGLFQVLNQGADTPRFKQVQFCGNAVECLRFILREYWDKQVRREIGCGPAVCCGR